MNKKTKKIIAREFLWVLFNAILLGILFLLETQTYPVNPETHYFQYIFLASLIFSFGIRYIYYATKWSIKQLREE